MFPSAVAEPVGRAQRAARSLPALAAVAVMLVLGGCSAAPSAASASPTGAPAATVSVEPSLAPSPVPPTDSPAPSPTPLDPCALITRDEANALAGVEVLDSQPAGNPPSRCVWPTPTTGAIGQVEIDVGDGAKKAYDIDSTVLHHDFQPVGDLGDEAYIEDKAIFFRVGDTWVAIHVIRLDSPSTLPARLADLARTVAGRV